MEILDRVQSINIQGRDYSASRNIIEHFASIVWSKKTWIGGFSKITLKGAAGDPQNLVYSESLPQCGP